MVTLPEVSLTSEGFIAYVLLFLFSLEYGLLRAPLVLKQVSAAWHRFGPSAAVAVPIISLVVAFAAATTANIEAYVQVSIVMPLYVAAGIMLLAIPAAAVPDGPAPGDQQGFANGIWMCVTAACWHAVIAKWQETENDGLASQLVRRGFIMGIAFVSSMTMFLQWALGRSHFWGVVRVSAAVCGVLRLTAIGALYEDGASVYPPGALPLCEALTVVSVMPATACLLTPTTRQRLARAVGASRRMQGSHESRPCSVPSGAEMTYPDFLAPHEEGASLPTTPSTRSNSLDREHDRESQSESEDEGSRL